MKIILILLLVVAKRLDIKREEILRLYHFDRIIVCL